MKIIRKRFLSLVLAVMMLLSCTAVASAADTSTAPVDSSAVELAFPNYSIAPRLTPVTIMQGVTSSSVMSPDFTLTANWYLEIVIASYVKVEATVYQLQTRPNGTGYFPINVYYIENTNGSGQTFSLGTGYSAGQYKVGLKPVGSGAYSYDLFVAK